AQTQIGLRDKVSYYSGKITRRPEKPAEIEFKRMISTEMRQLFGEDWLRADFVASSDRYEELNRRAFELSCKISNQMDLVYVPSHFYRQQLIAKILDPDKLRLLPHGTDVRVFHPTYREPTFWQRFGINGGPKVTYVGRIAK